MAVFPVPVIPALRPFRQAGVLAVLLDAATRAVLTARPLEVHGTPEAVEAGPASASASASAPPRIPLRAGASWVEAVPASANPEKPSRTAYAQHGEPQTQQGLADRPPDIRPNPHAWPVIWQERLARTPKNPRIVWTYPELGLDLTGKGNKDRGHFFRTFFQQLGMPERSHAFWPYWMHYDKNQGTDSPSTEPPSTEPPSTVPLAELTLFFEGIKLLRPDTVVLMGDEPPKHLGLPALPLMQPILCNGVSFVCLPSVETLMNDPGLSRIVNFLLALHPVIQT